MNTRPLPPLAQPLDLALGPLEEAPLRVGVVRHDDGRALVHDVQYLVVRHLPGQYAGPGPADSHFPHHGEQVSSLTEHQPQILHFEMSLCALQRLGQAEGSVQADQPAVAGVRSGRAEVGGDMDVASQLGGGGWTSQGGAGGRSNRC